MPAGALPPAGKKIAMQIRLKKAARRKRHLAPELGPRLLFFSGGTALRGLSHALPAYTHNSVHLITTFDSGGSSAVLRRHFNMPAVGDLRYRLMALTDLQIPGNQEIYALFAARLPEDGSEQTLRDEFNRLCSGAHPLMKSLPGSSRGIFRSYMQKFHALMPDDFDLRGASLGNLMLAAGYLDNCRSLNKAMFFFSRLLDVRGTVRGISEIPAHLAVKDCSGAVIMGQHRFTGKSRYPTSLTGPITDIWLTQTINDPEPAEIRLSGQNAELVHRADLICYPIGSFYSSVVANLLPSGVGQAIASNPCPKIFMPNFRPDPELSGKTLEAQIKFLLSVMNRDFLDPQPAGRFLSAVLLDLEQGEYPGGVPYELLEELGIEIIDLPLVNRSSGQTERCLDPDAACLGLLELCA